MNWDKINKEKKYSNKLALIQPILLKYIKKVIFNQSECEDICQNVILILIKKKSEYDSSKSFVSWCFRIADFQIKGFLSRRSRSRESSFGNCEMIEVFANKNASRKKVNLMSEWVENPLPSSQESLASPMKTFSNQNDFSKSDDIELIRLLKLNLTNRELKIFEMLLQGYSNKEIKKKLNFNNSSMSVNKYRLLCKLRGKLDLIKEYNKYDYQYCPF